MSVHRYETTLAIDLSSRGFGYAIFDNRRRLVDWGIRQVNGNKNDECVGRVKDLIDWYLPETIVLENPHAPGSRRHVRIRELSDHLVRLGNSLRVAIVRIPWSVVRTVCGRSVRANKEEIAAHVAEMLPEIRQHLPEKRRPWMSEDERMNIFDSAALGITGLLLHLRHRTSIGEADM